MNTAVIIVIAASVLLAVGVVVWRYLSYRGQRVLVCPENKQNVSVELDAWLAAHSEFDGEPVLRLQSCTRWPEREDCDQECLAQIEASPDGTLMRNIVAAWYRDKRCAYCRREIGAIEWHDALPALRSADGTPREWKGISAADVPAILETHTAICWNCSLVEGFRREHPELVVDRAETPLRERAIH
ncbi:MAG: hypothetical protein ABI837_08165 [Acidobacteriota bacterium]